MLSTFDYVKPQNLQVALDYLELNPGTKILAGGTDLLVLLRRNALKTDHLLDIKGIPETQGISYEAGRGLFIGAAVNVNQVAANALIREKYPALAQAADTVASYQIRNRATLVGNLCNASPGADLSGPLLVYEATVLIVSNQGSREVNLVNFFTGVKKTVLQPDELVIGIVLPGPAVGDMSMFLKQARIKGHDLGIVAVAALLTASGKVSLALSAVAPTPVRLTKLEEALSGQDLTAERAIWAGGEAAQAIQPISDVRSSAEYRRHAAGVLVKRALSQLLVMRGEQYV